ncbi:capsular polysaccharide biosynthesis protein [Limimaricola cinnabarinus]|uniref:Beta-3-deoxy-D-manno-oct-2-ulosonic acid transferase n=1 Tax=Limimaricola cinnabarinus TaxID=1125964 RepID=A0A2G1MJR9_9RHOB|nr:beta-3-deoxy-D-manno-oct-2-ulosonic acid transferase [Limimaricola cinnabarinus]
MPGPGPRRLYVYNGGLLARPMRARLRAAGYAVRSGLPGRHDLVGIWGASPTAQRGIAVAARRGAALVRIEDAFLRSVRPGRAGAPPLGLLIDHAGAHFDPARPSDLETLLATHPLDDTALLDRARDGISRMRGAGLTKYSGFDPDLEAPPPGYVLVVDQTAGDAAVRASRGDRNSFLEMLFEAREAHPGARILVKTHPETQQGFRAGHLRETDLGPNMQICDAPLSPWRLLEGAVAVHVFSSQMGFEAILAGHRPVVHGQPFYAGWGLTQDRAPVDRRQRRLTRAQLFAAAMILYPHWHDPHERRACSFETALDAFEAETRAWREDRAGWVASGMRLWKRRHIQKGFGTQRAVRFVDPPERAAALAEKQGRRLMVWGDRPAPEGAVRIEDGFLRSRGLGAALVPPASLGLDDLGLHYDPARESRMERLIAASPALPDAERRRARRLVEGLRAAGLSKYNLAGTELPPLPEGHRILVPGQVEDDAAIRLGAGAVRSNLALLQAVRAAHPEAVILYKPHPDVEAGLRPGAVAEPHLAADVVLIGVGAVEALEVADEVWTMTSGIGFEALLRERPVTCLGTPFYAGWGLTRDLGPPCPRRQARPDLWSLAHAALIGWPRYFDPVSGRPCPPELVLERLASGEIARRPGLRALARLQGVFASAAPLWRR